MHQDLYKRFLKNECSDTEVEEILKWFQNNIGSYLEVNQFKEIWDEYIFSDKSIEGSEAEKMLDKIHHKINIKESEKFNERKEAESKYGKKMHILITYFSRIAAILFLPLLFTLFYINNFNIRNSNLLKELVDLKVPAGSIMHQIFPDSSEVWLNQGSKISYPRVFNNNTRKVYLDGEGYFKIAHNLHKPFIVEVNHIEIVAMGTEFNIRAYPKDGSIETTLVEGRVTVQKESQNSKSSNKIFDMVPGQRLVFDINSNNYTCTQVYTENYTSWKNDELTFKHATLKEILRRLAFRNNVEFIVLDKELEKLTYNATFTDETLPQMLELLKKAAPIDFKIIKGKKLMEGSYSKSQIYVSYMEK